MIMLSVVVRVIAIHPTSLFTSLPFCHEGSGQMVHSLDSCQLSVILRYAITLTTTLSIIIESQKQRQTDNHYYLNKI
jgi:hypothetical protein